MNEKMSDFHGRVIHLTGRNPFDRSYHPVQAAYDLTIVQLLCKTINATMRIISSPRVTNLPSYEMNPNAWVVEQMTQGIADMSSHSLVLTPDSEKNVDYSVAIGTFRPQIYFKAQSVRMANNIYFLPFAFDTWIVLLSILLTITVVLTFILARETRLPHVTPYDLIARIADEKHDKGIDWAKIDLKLSPKEAKQREHWEITEILLVSNGALCQQGSERDPNTAAARTLLLALFVMAVLVYTAYSANLISLISLLPDTNKEIHYSTPINHSKIYLQDTNFFRYHLEVKTRANFLDLDEGLKKVSNENATFIADRDVSLTAIHNLGLRPEVRCSLARAFPGLEYQRVFAMRFKSPFKSSINYNILRLRQHGLLSRERKRLFKREAPCTAKERQTLSGFVSVDFADVRPALTFLIWAWITALIFLAVEFFIFYSSSELKKNLGNSWKKAEVHAAKVLNRWLKIKLIEGKNRH